MKTKIVVFIILIIGSFRLSSTNSIFLFPPDSAEKSGVINNLDSIIIDLANATLTATYIDIPVIILSDDVISSYDYALKFNLSKLTFSATIDLTPTDPTVISLSNYNPTDLFLRYTSSSLNGFPSLGVQLSKIRFNLSSTCSEVSAADFTDGLAILNGIQCAFRVSDLDFKRFIPSADFVSGPTCLNAGIQFSNTSTINSGSVTSQLWTFSNGDSSVVSEPITTFTAVGAKSATLIAISDAGCTDTIIKFINVNVLPQSSFSYSFDCTKDSVLFSNTSTITAGSISGYNWNFGDSIGNSNLKDPAYHYDASGIYTVTLLSISDFSCIGTSTLSIDLTNKVSANFTTNSFSTCIGATVSFSDATTYLLNPITAWEWNFGDASGTSNSQNPNYSFNTSGNFLVTLTSIASDNCKGFVTKSITVDGQPQIQFSVNSNTFCAIDSVTFNNLSITPQGSSYFWNFGDGNSSTIQNAVHSYTTFGLYQVLLTVTTPGGCVDSLSKLYTVSFPPPPPSLFTYTVISNALVSFSNTTPKSARVEWNFGDSQFSALNNPQHSFPEVETYSVCLTSYDTANCASAACEQIYVGLSRKVAVPSCFTPNQDYKNDILKVFGGPLSEMSFKIFNQWGNMIFSSDSQDEGWDGTFNGENQPVGVYKYILNGRTPDNLVINLYGVVTLIR